MTQPHEINSNSEVFRNNAELICHNPGAARLLASGNDSSVFELERYVYKKYSGERLKVLNLDGTFRVISLYQEITNKAAELSVSENWQMNVPYQNKSYPLRVNPMNAVINCSVCHTVIGVAPLIEGNTLEQETSLYDPNELKIALAKTSAWISNKLGVHHVILTGNNIKVLLDESMGKYLIITDLAADISMIALQE